MRLAYLAGLCVCIGCGIPHDPDGTFGRVQGSHLRTGITEREPWTRIDDNKPAGIEVELVMRFAEHHESEVEWTRGSESDLVALLGEGKLDLVVGGLTQSSPWSRDVGFTQPYLETRNTITGRKEKHVWAVPRGENRWLLELDRFLQDRRSEVRRLLGAAQP